MPSGVYKRTEAMRKNLSKALMGRKSWSKGKTKKDFPQLSNSGRKKGCIAHNKGVPTSKEVRLKISLANKGRMSPFKGVKRPELSGVNQPAWKGEEVSYRNLHRWVEKQIGKPCKCSECGKIGYGRQIHWANISGEYHRVLSDWVRLCSKCHGQYDKQKGFRKRNKLKVNKIIQ